jgi:hypothetical protein
MPASRQVRVCRFSVIVSLCREPPQMFAPRTGWRARRTLQQLALGNSSRHEPETSNDAANCSAVPGITGVKKSTISWIDAVRPARWPPCGLLGMRNLLTAIKGLPDAEWRATGAYRSTHGRDAANFLTASIAGENGRLSHLEPLCLSVQRGSLPRATLLFQYGRIMLRL